MYSLSFEADDLQLTADMFIGVEVSISEYGDTLALVVSADGEATLKWGSKKFRT